MALEELIGGVYKLITRYNTQHLKCEKCRALRTAEFMEHCGCSSAWELVGICREQVLEEVRLLGSVTGYHGMGMLEGVVEGVLKGM